MEDCLALTVQRLTVMGCFVASELPADKNNSHGYEISSDNLQDEVYVQD